MKKIVSVVSIICLFALCFSVFAGCSGNVSKVTKYADKLANANDFVTVVETKDLIGGKANIQEIIFSGNKMQTLAINYAYNKDTDEIGDALPYYVYDENNKKIIIDINEENKVSQYIDVVDEDTFITYVPFICYNEAHRKGYNFQVEWMSNENVGDGKAIIDASRSAAKALIKDFSLAEADLTWSKDAKAFLGKNALGTDYQVTAKSGALTVSYEIPNVSKIKVSYMNIGTARVSFPIICSDVDYQNKFEKNMKANDMVVAKLPSIPSDENGHVIWTISATKKGNLVPSIKVIAYDSEKLAKDLEKSYKSGAADSIIAKELDAIKKVDSEAIVKREGSRIIIGSKAMIKMSVKGK